MWLLYYSLPFYPMLITSLILLLSSGSAESLPCSTFGGILEAALRKASGFSEQGGDTGSVKSDTKVL